MKKINIKAASFVLSLLFCAGAATAQQQFTFSQYMNNLTPVNPCYSLLNDATNIYATGRKQFIGVDGGPSSFLFSGSTPLNSVAGSAGLTVLNDKIGVESSTEVNAFFAKKIQVGQNSYFAAAINGGFRNHQLAYSTLDASDPRFNSGDLNQTIPQVGIGVMYYAKNYYIGVSTPRIALQKDDSYSNTYYLAAAYLYTINDDFVVKPATLVAYAGNVVPTTADLSATFFVKKMFGLGVNYRTTQSVSGILSIMFNNNLQVGYSYGFSTGSYGIGGLNNSTQEFSLGYRFGKAGSRSIL